MTSREISFAPDRRSIQGDYYQFRYQEQLTSAQESFQHNLNEEYQHRFGLNQDLRNALIQNIIQYLTTFNYNITFLAAANYIVYQIRMQNQSLTPEVYGYWFDQVAPKIMSDLQGKKKEEIHWIKILYKIITFRYVVFIFSKTTVITDPTLNRENLGRAELEASSTEIQLGPQLVDFQVIEDLINSGNLANFEMRPEFQELANPPNSILTFIDNLGQEYSSQVQYDPGQNIILPPV